MRVLARIVCVGVIALGWVASACAPKDEIIPIIQVAPGFENRLALRPPTGSAYADAAARDAADAGTSATAVDAK
jgi:hypothetical protein